MARLEPIDHSGEKRDRAEICDCCGIGRENLVGVLHDSRVSDSDYFGEERTRL